MNSRARPQIRCARILQIAFIVSALLSSGSFEGGRRTRIAWRCFEREARVLGSWRATLRPSRLRRAWLSMSWTRIVSRVCSAVRRVRGNSPTERQPPRFAAHSHGPRRSVRIHLRLETDTHNGGTIVYKGTIIAIPPRGGSKQANVTEIVSSDAHWCNWSCVGLRDGYGAGSRRPEPKAGSCRPERRAVDDGNRLPATGCNIKGHLQNSQRGRKDLGSEEQFRETWRSPQP